VFLFYLNSHSLSQIAQGTAFDKTSTMKSNVANFSTVMTKRYY
jgi:hypothetical protein